MTIKELESYIRKCLRKREEHNWAVTGYRIRPYYNPETDSLEACESYSKETYPDFKGVWIPLEKWNPEYEIYMPLSPSDKEGITAIAAKFAEENF